MNGHSARKTYHLGPFNFTVSLGGTSASVGNRRVGRYNVNSHGRRRASVRLARGLRWSRSWKR